MSPGPVAALIGPPAGPDASLSWKGALPAADLLMFFVQASNSLTQGRNWLVKARRVESERPPLEETATGPFPLLPQSFLSENQLQFLRFDMIGGDGRIEEPDLVMWENFDPSGSETEGTSKAVGIKLPRSDLPRLDELIAGMMARTRVPFFTGPGYRFDAALTELHRLRSDLEAFASGAVTG